MAVKLPASCSSDSDAPRDLSWRDRDVRAPRDRYVQARSRGRTHVRSSTRPTAVGRRHADREDGEDVENAATRESLERRRLGTEEQRGAGNVRLELWQVEGSQQCRPTRDKSWTHSAGSVRQHVPVAGRRTRRTPRALRALFTPYARGSEPKPVPEGEYRCCSHWRAGKDSGARCCKQLCVAGAA